MPNRIIKESICTSESIDSLTWFEEAFFYRLIVNCDDYGLMDARPKVLKAKLFPLKDRVTVKEITDALVKLADAGCIQLYEVEHKPFLRLTTWGDHQRIRNKKTKYPEPEIDNLRTTADNRQTLDSNLLSNDRPPARVYENPIQSESESEVESEYCTEQNSAPKRGKPQKEDRGEIVMTLTLNDKSEYPFCMDDVSNWKELYPAVDILSELRKMKGWLDANPKRRKTKSGIMRFVNGWLSRAQDSGGSGMRDCENPYAELLLAEREGRT